jgi:hypothetical protein
VKSGFWILFPAPASTKPPTNYFAATLSILQKLARDLSIQTVLIKYKLNLHFLGPVSRACWHMGLRHGQWRLRICIAWREQSTWWWDGWVVCLWRIGSEVRTCTVFCVFRARQKRWGMVDWGGLGMWNVRTEGGRLGMNVWRMIWRSLVCMLNGRCSGMCEEASYRGKRLTLAERGRNGRFKNKWWWRWWNWTLSQFYGRNLNIHDLDYRSTSYFYSNLGEFCKHWWTPFLFPMQIHKMTSTEKTCRPYYAARVWINDNWFKSARVKSSALRRGYDRVCIVYLPLGLRVVVYLPLKCTYSVNGNFLSNERTVYAPFYFDYSTGRLQHWSKMFSII